MSTNVPRYPQMPRKFGTSWDILEHLGISGEMCGHLGTSWDIFWHFWIFWINKIKFWIFLATFDFEIKLKTWRCNSNLSPKRTRYQKKMLKRIIRYLAYLFWVNIFARKCWPSIALIVFSRSLSSSAPATRSSFPILHLQLSSAYAFDFH